ncbi:hypothetical protein ACFVHB_26810 [Kitasatospora sp. NPDC127111]|uniref:hypothetical protein n=1 Tax=Kitasatospora sp. NPDC127111 TaxID=3345363 RepID=UPI00363726F4
MTDQDPDSTVVGSLLSTFLELSRRLDETQSTLVIDPLLARTGDEVEAHGRLAELDESILTALRGGQVHAILEISQYYGHRFRSPRLRREFDERQAGAIEGGDRRTVRFCEAVLEAFDDDWEDRDLFPSLS